MNLNKRLVWALALAPAAIVAKPTTLPVTLHRGDDPANLQGLHGIARLNAAATGKSAAFTIEPGTFAKHDFWYGLFDVGDAKNLRLTFDTGSPFVVLNPGLYKPSSHSVNLNNNGNISYFGVDPDGCGGLEIFFDLYTDTITTQSGLTVSNQTIFKTFKHKSPGPGIETQLIPPFQGIVGLDANNANYAGGAFFGNACKQGKVDSCRFAVAFGTSGVGELVFGGVDKGLFKGKLSEKRLQDKAEWVINGSVASNGSIVERNQSYTLDTGTPNVLGWLPDVRRIFDLNGIQAVEQTISGCGKVLFGYYPCDSPPKIGFTVGSAIFEIEPSAFALQNNGHNNCTSTIVGSDGQGIQGADQWILGQAWMQGKYLDFDVTGNKIGAALLKNPANAS